MPNIKQEWDAQSNARAVRSPGPSKSRVDGQNHRTGKVCGTYISKDLTLRLKMASCREGERDLFKLEDGRAGRTQNRDGRRGSIE
jgi:hypothetical protein